MKTKFSVDIHAYSCDNSFFLEVIAKHNEGETFVTGDTFKAYETVNNIKYSTSSCKMEVKEEDDKTWEIFSGQKHVLTIVEWELHELNEFEAINLTENY